jgi:hypothetical protein
VIAVKLTIIMQKDISPYHISNRFPNVKHCLDFSFVFSAPCSLGLLASAMDLK